MHMISVYQATVRIGPNIHGEVYSFRPIPECVYPAAEGDVGRPSVEVVNCTRFVIEAPDWARIVTSPAGGDAIPDPERADGFVTWGPKFVLDLAHRGDAFKRVRIHFRYWETREIIERMEREPGQSS